MPLFPKPSLQACKPVQLSIITEEQTGDEGCERHDDSKVLAQEALSTWEISFRGGVNRGGARFCCGSEAPAQKCQTKSSSKVSFPWVIGDEGNASVTELPAHAVPDHTHPRKYMVYDLLIVDGTYWWLCTLLYGTMLLVYDCQVSFRMLLHGVVLPGLSGSIVHGHLSVYHLGR